jgi:hypothetical protein
MAMICLDKPERPWVGSAPPCDEVDKQLFRVSTIIFLGDGNKASFWNCSWLNGLAPRDIAPGLYKLAWRKNRTVKEDITDQQWTRGLWRMDSVDLMAQFVVLWDAVQQIQLTDSFRKKKIQLTDRPDEIVWRWSANGTNTSKPSAILMLRLSGVLTQKESIGSLLGYSSKRKFLQPTKLLARNWPCESNCVLCDPVTETAAHLCLQCPFAKQLWLLVNSWTNNVIPLLIDLDEHVDDW